MSFADMAVLFLVVLAAVGVTVYLRKQRKAGKSCCSGCAGCAGCRGTEVEKQVKEEMGCR